jgi:plastocyanin
MKKTTIFSVLIITALLFIAGCSQAGQTSRLPAPTQASAPPVETQPSLSVQERAPSPQQGTPVRGGVETVDTQQQRAAADTNAQTDNVEIQSFAFSPATLTVKRGTTVIWTQMDSTPHTIMSDAGIFKSAELSKGQTYSNLFKDAGTFTYHCSIHPSMTGTIVVE